MNSRLGDPRWHDILWWYHVNKCRAMRGNRSEFALSRKSPRCHVSTPYYTNTIFNHSARVLKRMCLVAIRNNSSATFKKLFLLDELNHTQMFFFARSKQPFRSLFEYCATLNSKISVVDKMNIQCKHPN